MNNWHNLPACPFCGTPPATTDDGTTVWCSAGTLPNGDLCPIEGVDMPAEAWRAIFGLKDRAEKAEQEAARLRTNAVYWTRYDGTLDTLPDLGTRVLLFRCGHVNEAVLARETFKYNENPTWLWAFPKGHDVIAQPGVDIWAPCPT